MLNSSRARRAFSLIELAVVLIVIALVATIAIPTYLQTTRSAEHNSILATLNAAAREAGVLAALADRGGFDDADFETAISELTAAAPGVYASGGWQMVAGDVEPESFEVSVAVASDGLSAGLAAVSPTGCAGVRVSFPANTAPVTVAGDCTGEEVLGTPVDNPSGPVDPGSPPVAVTDAVLTPGDHSVLVTWNPGESSTTTTVSATADSVEVYSGSVLTQGCNPGCALTIPGLIPGAEVSVSLVAVNGAVSADPVVVSGVPTGPLALVALMVSGDVVEHPFANWAEGATLFAALEADPNVVAVSYAMPFTDMSNRSTDPRRGDQWYLDMLRAEDVFCVATGSGVGVAVIDSGVEPLADFGGRVRAGVNFDGQVGTGRSPSPGDHHGTAVAGIIAAGVNNAGLAGAAPGVDIYPYDVSTGPGASSSADALYSAWAAALANPQVKVVNISMASVTPPTVRDRLGALLGVSNPVGALDAQLGARSMAEGKLTVAATGNNNANVAAYPAAADGVLAVGAVGANRARGVWNGGAGGSNWGSHIDVVAGGGLGPDGSGFAVYQVDGSISTSGVGTSYAAPLVSAVAALLWDVNPGLSPVAVREAIVESATDAGPTGWDDLYGWGIVTATGAFNHLGILGAEGCAPPPQNVTAQPGGSPSAISVGFDGDGPHRATCSSTSHAGDTLTVEGSSSPLEVTDAVIGGTYSCTVAKVGGGVPSSAVTVSMPSVCTSNILSGSVTATPGSGPQRVTARVLVRSGMRVTSTTLSRVETKSGDPLFRNYYWRYGLYVDPEGVTGFHGWRWDNNYSQWHRLDGGSGSRSFGPTTTNRSVTTWTGAPTVAYFMVESSSPGADTSHQVTASVQLTGCS